MRNGGVCTYLASPPKDDRRLVGGCFWESLLARFWYLRGTLDGIYQGQTSSSELVGKCGIQSFFIISSLRFLELLQNGRGCRANIAHVLIFGNKIVRLLYVRTLSEKKKEKTTTDLELGTVVDLLGCSRRYSNS